MLSLARRFVAATAPRCAASRGLLTARIVANEATDSAAPASSSSPSGQTEVGTVKWFSKEKGYGFITRGDGTDVFVHFSNVRGTGFRTLEEGQAVDFVTAPGKKGMEARDVTART